MKFPRLTIGRLMGGVLILSLGLALLRDELTRRSATPISAMALWPTLTAFGIASFAILRQRGQASPFLRGFAVSGWISVAGYLAICRWRPEWVQRFILYYWNDLDYWWIVWFIDASHYPEIYYANLTVIGLILAAPELMIATLGGWIARWIWGKRWTTT